MFRKLIFQFGFVMKIDFSADKFGFCSVVTFPKITQNFGNKTMLTGKSFVNKTMFSDWPIYWWLPIFFKMLAKLTKAKFTNQ